MKLGPLDFVVADSTKGKRRYNRVVLESYPDEPAVDTETPHISLSPSGESIRLRLVSDYICPWCYIGRVRLEHLRAEFALQIQISAFDLRPGLPAEGLPRESVYGQNPEFEERQNYVRELARAAGITLGSPAIIADTGKAHEATEFAKLFGKEMEFSLGVFRAYWEQGQNIGDQPVLSWIADETGLDGDELARSLEEGRFSGEVADQVRWARWAGVTGVPTFVFNDRFALVGAQPQEVLRNAVQKLQDGRDT